MSGDGFQGQVRSELARAREKHPGQQHSLHEGYAVLLEELDEFWDEVKARSENRSQERTLSELVQVAAMAQRTAEDLVMGDAWQRPREQD